jgi:hypothetical protein
MNETKRFDRNRQDRILSPLISLHQGSERKGGNFMDTAVCTLEADSLTVEVSGFAPDEDVHVQTDFFSADGIRLWGFGGHGQTDADGHHVWDWPFGYELIESAFLLPVYRGKKISLVSGRAWTDNVAFTAQAAAH